LTKHEASATGVEDPRQRIGQTVPELAEPAIKLPLFCMLMLQFTTLEVVHTPFDICQYV